MLSQMVMIHFIFHRSKFWCWWCPLEFLPLILKRTNHISQHHHSFIWSRCDFLLSPLFATSPSAQYEITKEFRANNINSYLNQNRIIYLLIYASNGELNVLFLGTISCLLSLRNSHTRQTRLVGWWTTTHC